MFENPSAKKVNFQAKFNEQLYSISLDSKEQTRKSFSVSDIKEPTYTNIEISGDVAYKIPVAAIITLIPQYNTSVIEADQFKFKPDKIDLSLREDKTILHVNLTNYAFMDIKDIKLITNNLDIAKIEPDNFDLSSGTEKTLTLTLQGSEGIYNGTIEARTENFSTFLSIYVNVSKDAIVVIPPEVLDTPKSCIDLGGFICSEKPMSGEKIKLNVDRDYYNNISHSLNWHFPILETQKEAKTS